MGTCVVTDPSAVMPQAWVNGRPIAFVPVEVVWPDGSIDAGDAPYGAVAGRIRDADVPPTTGAPSPGTFAQLITGLLREHDGVLVICPSADLSATYQSAVLGSREVSDERVRVLDSKTAAAGQGIVVAEAARIAAGGAGLDETHRRAIDVAGRIHIWATLAQLHFLRRSGRVPALAAIGAGALGLQPVVRYAQGAPSPVGVVRSVRGGSDRLFRAWERSRSEGSLRAVAFHSARAEEARHLIERIAAETAGADAHVVEVSASLASHTGDGLLGLAWFWDLDDGWRAERDAQRDRKGSA
jgi:DegV family protein with EDD domain